MLRCLSSGAVLLVALLAAAVPAAIAAEPAPEGLEGAFALKGTNGYGLFGLVASTPKGGALTLFVGNKGGEATYEAHGEVTTESVDFDLGALGKIDVAVQPTGKTETLNSKCDGSGKSTTIPATELVGTIEFHGEEGFTDVEATRTPLLLKPISEIVCGAVTVEGKEGGDGIPGAGLAIKRKGGPSLKLAQNRPGAPVFYTAQMKEKDGPVTVERTVGGYLRGGVLTYAPSLAAAHFAGAGPFSGSATYAGKSVPRPNRPGKGPWRGNLTVDFPGHADVAIAGPGFEASIFAVHRDRPRTVKPN
jgi:hypothetical protein